MDRLDISAAKWYTAPEAGRFLDVTEATVKSYCRSGKVEAKQFGPRKQWRVRGSSILALLREWNFDEIDGQEGSDVPRV